MTSDFGGNIQPGETVQTDRVACQTCTQRIKLKEATKHGAAWWKWSKLFEKSQYKKTAKHHFRCCQRQSFLQIQVKKLPR